MNILITTFGTSWQIAPELFGFTNPQDYDFFKGNSDVEKLRKNHNIQAIDELWIITTSNSQNVSDKLRKWQKGKNVIIKQIECSNVSEFHSNDEVVLMRSCIYATVANACELVNGGTLYLSLTGGRKTMSADMQAAGYLFGCNAILHMIDKFPDREAQKKFNDDEKLSDCTEYANWFLPVIISENLRKNSILEGSNIEIPKIEFNNNICKFNDGGNFAEQIQRVQDQSSQLYSNYISALINYQNGRSIFYKLYFLHSDIIERLQKRIIGNNKESDISLLKKLPKADLHSHLGGILTPSEIIETAKTNRNYDKEYKKEIEKLVNTNNLEELDSKRQEIFEIKNKDFEKFYSLLCSFILAFENKAELFDELIFGKYIDTNNFYKIGLETYQKLGDFQGSSLLQTKEAIAKAVELYAKKLIDDNVKYVEIRCSPYKYIKLGLNAKEVTSTIIKTMDKLAGDKITYGLILIVGRDAKGDEIKNSVKNIIELYNDFKEKIIGVDLAGTEEDNPPQNFREAFLPLLEKCLSITIHAGETEAVDNIWEAVYHLNAERIGHGLKLNENPALIKSFLNKNIGIEMCPSSNDQIVGYSKTGRLYPLKYYMKEGLKVTVNTDNCGISRTSLSNEFYKAAQLSQLDNGSGLSLWDCIVLIRNSLSIAFVPKNIKSYLMKQFEDEIFELCEQEIII
ncbi:MAG: CRISPR-associated ring nuclease [Treponemataceae bacterium]